MKERWKDVVGYEGRYRVSSHGRVESLSRVSKERRWGSRVIHGKILSTFDRGNGYQCVRLCRDGDAETVGVHQIVCEAFHGPRPDGHCVAHSDGTRDNNTYTNLRWATYSENCMDRHRHGTAPVGEQNNASKLTETCVHMARAMWR